MDENKDGSLTIEALRDGVVGLRPPCSLNQESWFEKLSQNSFQLNGQVLFDGGSPIS